MATPKKIPPVATAAGPAIKVVRPNKRTAQTRERIGAALMELVREGNVNPTAEVVSVRARVGLRTVYRHFDDMNDLYSVIYEQASRMVMASLYFDFKAKDWQGRLRESLQHRCQLNESFMPYKISGEFHRHLSDFVRQHIREIVDLERSLLTHVLPKTVQADKSLLDALLLVLSLDSWIRLRRDQGLSFASAFGVVQRTLNALMAA